MRVVTLLRLSYSLPWLGGLCVVAGTPALAGEGVNHPSRTPAELVRLVRQDCGACHGLRLTGGLGSPLTAAALAARGIPESSIEAVILHGRPGTAMPAWKSLLTGAEAGWIARQLLQGFPEEGSAP